MAIDESDKLLDRHQRVDEVRDIDRVLQRKILFERAVDVARVFSDHSQQTPSTINQVALRVVVYERFEVLARGSEVLQAMFCDADSPECFGALGVLQTTLQC